MIFSGTMAFVESTAASDRRTLRAHHVAQVAREAGENAKKLIEQAKANVIAFPTDPLQAIVDLLGGSPGAAKKAGQSLGNMPGPPEPNGDNSHGPDKHAAMGFHSPKLPKNTLIQAHTGEDVIITTAGKKRGSTMDVDQMMDAMAHAASSRSDGADIVMHHTLNVDGKAVGEWITRAPKTGKVRIHQSSMRAF